MASGQWSVVLRHVQRLFHGGSVAGLTEGQLLDRFVSSRDEAAFGAIVHRHGPMVLGVCRGVLDDPRDVEDAFQATFLVLVRKAGGLRDRDLLGRWLYGVARKVALRARADASRRRLRERPESEAEPRAVATFDAELRELQSIVREEVDRLSGNDRMAVVLCYLEGMTHEEAADRLGWPIGTVKGRLSRARDKLRDRLTRRGVALPDAFASTRIRGESAIIPPQLLASTTLAATRLAAGQVLTAGIVSAHALTLMEGVIGTMLATKLKIVAVALAASCTLAVPGVMAYQKAGSAAPAQSQVPLPPEPPRPTKTVVETVESARTGEDADVSRSPLVDLSEKALQAIDQQIQRGVASPASAPIYLWSRRLVEAQTGPDVPEPARIKALRAHHDRMKQLSEQSKALVESARLSVVDVLDAEYHLVEAARWLRQGRVGAAPERLPAIEMTGFGGFPAGERGGLAGRAGRPGGPAGPKPAGVKQTAADEKRHEAILAKLEEKLSMNFPNSTPFEDIKKYIEAATQDEAVGFPTGLPIYVDPDGLKDAGATMASTISMNLQGVPLRTTLRLALNQLGLAYRLDGGVIVISDVESIDASEMKEMMRRRSQ